MPSAPASSAIRAACSTLGIPLLRVFRISATLFRLTLSAVMAVALQLPKVLQDAPCVQRLAIEVIANNLSQQRLAFGNHLRMLEIARGHRDQRATADSATVRFSDDVYIDAPGTLPACKDILRAYVDLAAFDT